MVTTLRRSNRSLEDAQLKMQQASKIAVSFRQQNSQAGYVLLSVLILASILLIALSTAAPKIATEIQRDKETELYHRGMQYSRAIRLYYKRFGRYPNNLTELEQTDGIRFLRKRYRDPITGGDQWRLIHRGEARLTADDLFHVAIPGGTASTGTPQPGLPSPLPSSNGQPGGIMQAQPASGSNQSPFGSPQSATGSPQSPFASNQSPFASNASPFGSSSQPAYGSTFVPTSSTSNTNPTGTDNQTFGGIGIVGVASLSPKKSLREYKKQQHYDQWEFTYDASLEIMGAANLSAPPPVQPTPSAPTGPLLPSATQPAPPPTGDAPSPNPQ
jgi:type II secretory pathway pseudopilin PulG